MPSSTTSMPHLPPLAQSGDFLNNLINFIATYFLCEGTFSRCWHFRSTLCLRVLPLDSSPQAAMSGQCLLPLLLTSLSSPFSDRHFISHFPFPDSQVFQIPHSNKSHFFLLKVRDHLLRQPRAPAGRHQHRRVQPRPHHLLPCQVSSCTTQHEVTDFHSVCS